MLCRCVSCGLLAQLDDGRIPPELFDKYLNFFLQDNPFKDCAKGGHAAYSQAVATEKVNTSGVTGYRAASSYFMTYHTVLKSSQDYTEAMKEARMIAENITKTLNRGMICIRDKTIFLRLHANNCAK